MARIVWDAIAERLFETGIDHCVLYPMNASGAYTPGVPWNGITQVSETPDGAEPNDQYADNIKYFTLISAEELGGTIEAFMYPDEWNQCDGNVEVSKGVVIGQQNRKTFGLSYRTRLGNATDGADYGYKLHLLYGAKASPSERTYETINDSPEPNTLSWDYNTTPVAVKGYKPTSLITINSTTVDPEKLAALEDLLYGSEDEDDTTPPRLPLPDEVLAMFPGAVTASLYD